MGRCWASCLGDCSDKISGEHVITAGIHLSETMKVKGLPLVTEIRRAVSPRVPLSKLPLG